VQRVLPQRSRSIIDHHRQVVGID